jgi:hypothetical protein
MSQYSFSKKTDKNTQQKERTLTIFIYTMNTVRHLSSTHALLQSLWAK